jgi:hypothetical protein
MRYFLPVMLVLGFYGQPGRTEMSLEKGFNGAVLGCEEWLLNPGSWASGPEQFVKATGLGNQIGPVDQVDEVNLPPAQMRRAMHFWRINSTQTAGYVLVVSDQLPMCHITGGGDTDLQPSVENVLSLPGFVQRWEKQETRSGPDMVSTTFRSRTDPALSLVVSRAKLPAQRLDRVQVLATATYETGSK